MLVVREEMLILSVKKLAPCCTQTKISLDGVSYKRVEYSSKCVQWLSGKEFLEKDKELILENIYSKRVKLI